jgi:hypothetical protein
MITHKEFYFWLEGYLHGRLEDEHITISPIVEKMREVKDVDPFFPRPRTITPPTFEPIPVAPNPFKEDGYDDLGTPPKIVM